jgi:lipid II:glycine glycyltransferase (peptidoglycan interpeptide bridge formation enzyme)
MLSIDALPTSGEGELHHTTRDEWIELAGEFQDHNYRHCWDYAAMMATRSNAAADHVVISREDSPVALASVRVKRLRGAGTGIAYVSGGPLVRHRGAADADERLAAALEALKREYVERRRMVLRVAPAPGDAAWNSVQARCFAAAGFAVADHLQPYRTMFVDISRPHADIRAGLAQKWRNCLNKAERQDLTVTEGWDDRLFDDFSPLFDELVARKSFDAPLGPDFYAQLQRQLPTAERLLVAIAQVDDEPAAGIVASIHGDTAVYLLGASNDAGRKRNASYLLQWKVIEAAMARGCRWYDLGGVDVEANPGVYKFKLGLGGEELVSPGPFELAGDRLRWTTVRAAERAFRVASTVRRSR